VGGFITSVIKGVEVFITSVYLRLNRGK